MSDGDKSTLEPERYVGLPGPKKDKGGSPAFKKLTAGPKPTKEMTDEQRERDTFEAIGKIAERAKRTVQVRRARD